MQNNTPYFDTKCKIKIFFAKKVLTFVFLYDIIPHSVNRKVDETMMNFNVMNKKFGAVASYSLFIFSFNI